MFNPELSIQITWKTATHVIYLEDCHPCDVTTMFNPELSIQITWKTATAMLPTTHIPTIHKN